MLTDGEKTVNNSPKANKRGSRKKGEMRNPHSWRDSRMKRHDKYNFEVKIDYNLEENRKKNDYALDAYFFVPEVLQINRETYSNKQFFSDIHVRSRFKTPQMTLEGIMNTENNLSPIYKINIRLNKIKNGISSKEINNRLTYELKLLGCMIRANFRDQFNYFLKQNKALHHSEGFLEQFLTYLNKIQNLQKEKEILREEFSAVQIASEIRQAFDFVDDFIGYQIMRRLTISLNHFTKEDYDQESHIKIRKKIINLINSEQEHRESFQTHLNLKKNSKNESFAYWWGILKKFVQGILYLDIKKKKEKSASLQFFHSIAAGVAMFVSIYITILVSQHYQQNSIPYILALVLGYMLKDRIKENIRWISNKTVGILFPDKKQEFIDIRHGIKLGKSKETMHFITWDEIPAEIINIREASNKSIIEREGKPEIVFKYKRRIELLTENIKSVHQRSGDVNDIIRFNVRKFIQYADDPTDYELMWYPEEKEIRQEEYHKVYHMNVIFRMKEYDENENEKIFYKKIRVVFDQNGIKKVKKPIFTL